MANRVLTWAMEQRTGSPTRKAVLIKLADQSNDDGYCWPSKETIARHCELHARTVQKLISELEELGFLSVKRRREENVNLTNVYQIHYQGVEALRPQGEAQKLQGGGARPPGVEAQDLPEPSFEPSREPLLSACDPGSEGNRFEEWWSEYPKKRAKKACRDKWSRKRLDRIADQLIADVQARRRKDARWLRGYPPDPLTYLNQERWEDEIESEPVNGHRQEEDPFDGCINRDRWEGP